MSLLPHTDLLASLIDTELIYQNAPSGYLSILPDGTVIKLNNTLLQWLGYGEDDILYKKKFSDLLSKGGNIHYEMFFRPMITINGNIKELNYELIRKDDTTFPALINGSAVKDENDKLLAVNMVITDITQRNLYEKELLKSKNLVKAEKERFEFLAEVSLEMIWTINRAGQVTYLNKRVCEYFNLPASELTTETIFRKIHEDDRRGLIRKWLMENNTGEALRTVFRLKKEGAEYEWFEVRIVSSGNEVQDIKWFGTCISIDEHIKAMKRKDEFIDMASHELKTPITVLYGYLELIQMYTLPAEVSGFVTKSLAALDNFQFLISTLLNVSVINSGELKLNVSRYSLNKLLEDSIGQLRHTLTTHKLILETVDHEMFAVIDRERILQVVINLLTNAVKYSPAATSVVLKLKQNASDAIVSITDFGEGIPVEELDRIFDKYYRAENQRNKTGLGLGLYISQNILLAHSTKLKVSSTMGEGSVFSFALPLSMQ